MVSTPKNPNLKSHDPYQNMETHITRPDHIKQSASNELKSAEQSASQKSTLNPKSAIEHENSHQRLSRFTNNVKGKSTATLNPKSKKSFLKSKGPLAFLLMAFFGGAALFITGQSVLGPHLSALYTEATDVQFTSYSLRNQRLFSYMLDGGNQIKPTLFSKKFTTFTPYMKSRLAKNGIDVEGSGSSRILKFNGETITASDFQTKYASDANFREAYYDAKRGRVAGFFDDVSEKVYAKLGLTRNIFDNYKSTGDNDTDTDNFKDTLSSKIADTDTDIGTARHETEIDEDGNTTTETIENETTTKVNNIEGDTPKTKARALASSLASKVSTVGGPTCAALRVANMINIAAFASSMYKSISYFMGIMENVSKMMNGEGNSSAINEVLNFLTTPSTTETEQVDASGNIVTTSVTGSPIESNGSRIVLGSTAPKNNTEQYSLESITSAATRTVILSGATSTACSAVQAASAIVSLTATAVPGGTIAKMVISMLAETVGGIVISGIAASIVSAIIPLAAKALFTNVVEDYTGIPAGELFSQGGAASNFNLAKSASAYTPASEERLTAQARATTQVLAQEAELDRNKRSPFDITSNNTFLGSIVSSTIPFLSNSSIFAPISALANLSASALNQLTPLASANGTNLYTTTYGNCPALESIGAKGDIYCNAIPATDLSTIDLQPDDPTYEKVISTNLKSDGETIKDNSELAKFINFCTNRESPFGVTDANILNSLQTDFGVVLNNVPILNDVVDLVNAAEDASNQAWATGANCVNSSKNSRWNSEFKYYQRYIEDTRILGQMGAYEDSKNPVLAYQEKYETEHPGDNSTTGILSRITGLSQDDVAFMLEFVEYSNFIADYDASKLAPIAANASALSPLEKLPQTPDSRQNTEHILISQSIIYTDTRNRSFAS